MLSIDKEKCNGCRNLNCGAQCVSVCPGDLLSLGAEGKVLIHEPGECWDCLACVKACPRMSLSIHLPFQINESMTHMYSRVLKKKTVWQIRSPQGQLIKRYESPSTNQQVVLVSETDGGEL